MLKINDVTKKMINCVSNFISKLNIDGYTKIVSIKIFKDQN